MQGQYGVCLAGIKCTFQSQDCTFHRPGSHRHSARQAQSSRACSSGLPSGFSLFTTRKTP
ncbi:hypothetical protein BFW88_10780 [Pseudomonas fluorescens]|nr:hypothetical protein BFW88_10780 [Pseudomonas fluorescens]OPB11727.1 hypothetical protein BFW92_10745 [Pseudomonas fluorescens]OPB22943.1 hypothetical protein BFW93_10775 [Pseudomonas fluorescens]